MQAAEELVLPEAPTFFPTEEEWGGDPLRYIATVVRPAAEQLSGIARIVPPAGWEPPFAIDRGSFEFRTRLQAVQQLQSKETSVAVKKFWDDYGAFQASKGIKHRKAPTYAGKEIDLYAFHRLVTRRGGYTVVTEQKRWREVAHALQVGAPQAVACLPITPTPPCPTQPRSPAPRS